MMCGPGWTWMPSSSRSSRTSACSGVSPRSILPPGNSHSPARSRPTVRRARSTRPRGSVMAAATTSTCLMVLVRGPQGRGSSSGQLAVAVLVLLAAAARARVVAADLGALAHHGLRARHGLALRWAAVLVVGGGGFLVGAVAAGVGVLELGLAQARLDLPLLLGLHRRDLLLGADAHPRQHGHHFQLDLL